MAVPPTVRTAEPSCWLCAAGPAGSRPGGRGGSAAPATPRAAPRPRSRALERPELRRHCRSAGNGSAPAAPGSASGGRPAPATARSRPAGCRPAPPPVGRRQPSSAPAQQSVQPRVEVPGQGRSAAGGRHGQRADNNPRPQRQPVQPVPHEMAEPACRPVPDDGIADRPAHGETDQRPDGAARSVSRWEQGDDQTAPSHPTTTANRGREVFAAT